MVATRVSWRVRFSSLVSGLQDHRAHVGEGDVALVSGCADAEEHKKRNRWCVGRPHVEAEGCASMLQKHWKWQENRKETAMHGVQGFGSEWKGGTGYQICSTLWADKFWTMSESNAGLQRVMDAKEVEGPRCGKILGHAIREEIRLVEIQIQKWWEVRGWDG